MMSNETTIPYFHAMDSARYFHHIKEQPIENYLDTTTASLLPFIIGGGGGLGQANPMVGTSAGSTMQQLGLIPPFSARTTTPAATITDPTPSLSFLLGMEPSFSTARSPYSLLSPGFSSSSPSSRLFQDGPSTSSPFAIEAPSASILSSQSATSSVIATAYRNWLLERVAQGIPNLLSEFSSASMNPQAQASMLYNNTAATAASSVVVDLVASPTAAQQSLKERNSLGYHHYDSSALSLNRDDGYSSRNTAQDSDRSLQNSTLCLQDMKQRQSMFSSLAETTQAAEKDTSRLQQVNHLHCNDRSSRAEAETQEKERPCNKRQNPSNSKPLQSPQDNDQKNTDNSSKKQKRHHDHDYVVDQYSNNSGTTSITHRFQQYQSDMWQERFQDLLKYREQHGNCQVPLTYNLDPGLARWVKRQRYQYKLLQDGRPSTMTQERVQALEDIGFVWDSQGTAWLDRFNELVQFKRDNKHCNVPSRYPTNPALAIWVKCQRRQYKLFNEGALSNITSQRIRDLESIGFQWLLRSYHRKFEKSKTNKVLRSSVTDSVSSSSVSSASSSSTILN